VSETFIEYFPLHPGPKFDRAYDLLGFDWQNTAVDFIIPDDDDHVLRVTFDSEVIVRLLDELWFRGEDYQRSARGLDAQHFVYRVEGSKFSESHSDWDEVQGGPPTHYRFITKWGSVDVLSLGEPRFAIIPRALAVTQSQWRDT
jgi:hypothetical protein